MFYIREDDGCTRSGTRRGMRRGRGKRRGLLRLEEEQEEDIRRGLSNKRYISTCIIEDTSLTFY